MGIDELMKEAERKTFKLSNFLLHQFEGFYKF